MNSLLKKKNKIKLTFDNAVFEIFLHFETNGNVVLLYKFQHSVQLDFVILCLKRSAKSLEKFVLTKIEEYLQFSPFQRRRPWSNQNYSPLSPRLNPDSCFPEAAESSRNRLEIFGKSETAYRMLNVFHTIVHIIVLHAFIEVVLRHVQQVR